MLSPFKDYFHYSRGERIGVSILLGIIFLLISWYFVRGFFVSNTTTDFTDFKKEISLFKKAKLDAIQTTNSEIEYFVFNPNTIGEEDWVKLGFSQKQAVSIENYKASGAVFKTKKDVLKLFMVDEFKYAQLEAYIDLPEKIEYEKFEYDNKSEYQNFKSEYSNSKFYIIVLEKSPTPIYGGFENIDSLYYSKRDNMYWYCVLPFENEVIAKNLLPTLEYKNAEVIEVNSLKGFYLINKKPKETFEKNYEIIEINTADTLAFSSLPGIGIGYAKRIIKYRNLLGGFIHINQMKETYKLPPEIIDNNLSYFSIDSSQISKININIAGDSILRNHPYIDWKVANSIVQMRNVHGKYKKVSNIKKSVLIDEKLFLKIAPYLTTE